MNSATLLNRHRRPPVSPDCIDVDLIRADVERFIRSSSDNCGALSAPVARLQSTPGKRLRALVLVGFATLGSPSSVVRLRALMAAAAIEMIHEGSLVHDDVVDRSLTRRGQPSTAAEFGIRSAAHVGVHLVAKGISLLASARPSIAIETDFHVLQRLAYAQMLERMPLEPGWEGQMKRTLDIMDGKTGTLFAAAAGIGARICGTSAVCGPAGSALVERFALELSRGFQIRDDVLDLTDDPRLGDTGGTDLGNGTPSWPVLLWAKDSWGERSARLRASRDDAHLRNAIRREILDSRLIHAATRDANGHLACADALLATLPESAGAALLRPLVRGLMVQ